MPQPDFLPPDNDPNRPGPALHSVSETPHLSEIKEESAFASLVSNIRDVFFPKKLPPLVLESKPVPVPDPMKVKRNPRSTGIAIGAHILVLALILFLLAHHVNLGAPPAPKQVAQLTLPPPPPPPALVASKMGGGGGQHDNAPVSKGRLPQMAQQQILKPTVAPPPVAPKLAVAPTVVVQKNLQMANNSMPNLGAPSSNLPGVSLGNGSGGGIGGGNGNGIGPGTGGNTGGGFYHIGGKVSAPVVVYQVDPEFSEEARKAKFSGNVEVYLIVDAHGNPTHVQVVRDVGMGLGQKAVEAVRQYKFRPAMKDGKPVAVDMYIDVNFQIF